MLNYFNFPENIALMTMGLFVIQHPSAQDNLCFYSLKQESVVRLLLLIIAFTTL